MEYLEAVVLQYEIGDRLEFQNCAELLRLAGIYIWERYIGCHDRLVTASENMTGAEFIDVSVMLKETGKAGEDSRRDVLTLLSGKLEEAQKKEKFTNISSLLEALQTLRDIYQEHHLFQAATVLQYFRMNDRLVDEAGASFKGAADSLENICLTDEKEGGNQYLQYARLYCLQKSNLARRLRDQPLSVLADVLADECLKLAADFPDFSNAMVLRGLAFETSERNSREAVESFNEAARKVGKYPFASSIYYWIGKRCEVYKTSDMVRLTKEAYGIGYKLEPKYRLCYKMAFVSERGSYWQEADKFYRECMDYISRKGDYLDPLEQEYSYKTAIRAAYNCLAHLEDVTGAVRLLLGAEKLRENLKSGMDRSNQYTRYYFGLYGSDAPSYVKLELSRMGTLQLYQYLTKAYQILGNQQEAAKYGSLFEVEREKAEKRRRSNKFA